MSLFPAYIENKQTLQHQEEKQIPKEYGIDFETGQLTGKIVEDAAAIKVWIWLVLQTPRYRYYVYTWDYGNDFEELIGQGYTKEYIETEVKRMTKECLLINEYINEVTDFTVGIENESLTISFIANTIYGDIAFQNQQIAAPTTA